MSPEYAVDGKYSVKSDVFSLGVLLLEIVSGRKNRKFHHLSHHHNLLGHVSTYGTKFSSFSLFFTKNLDLPELTRIASPKLS